MTEETKADALPETKAHAELETKAPAKDESAAKADPIPLKGIECCGSCYYSRGVLSAAGMQMECRRESPKVFQMMGPRGQVGHVGAFPPTKRELWCGEWAPKA